MLVRFSFFLFATVHLGCSSLAGSRFRPGGPHPLPLQPLPRSGKATADSVAVQHSVQVRPRHAQEERSSDLREFGLVCSDVARHNLCCR